MSDSRRQDSHDTGQAQGAAYREVERSFFGHLALIPVNVYTRKSGQSPSLVAIAGSNVGDLPRSDELPFLVTETDLANIRSALPDAVARVLAGGQPVQARMRLAYDLTTAALASALQPDAPPLDAADVDVCERTIGLLVATATGDEASLAAALGAVRPDRQWQFDAINTCLYAVAIGQQVRLSPDELALLARGAFFHDIGMTRLPRSMVESSGRLNPGQRIKLRLHPARGVEMLQTALGSEPTYAPLVLNHHERIDGSGYPDGADALPLGRLNQIVGLADVFEALTATRTYRGPEGAYDAARIIIREMRGAFEPDLLRALIGALGSP